MKLRYCLLILVVIVIVVVMCNQPTEDKSLEEATKELLRLESDIANLSLKIMTEENKEFSKHFVEDCTHGIITTKPPPTVEILRLKSELKQQQSLLDRQVELVNNIRAQRGLSSIRGEYK